jgi:hypothetical protein
MRLSTVGDPPRWPRDTSLSTKDGTKILDRGGHSVGMVSLRTKCHGVYFLFFFVFIYMELVCSEIMVIPSGYI